MQLSGTCDKCSITRLLARRTVVQEWRSGPRQGGRLGREAGPGLCAAEGRAACGDNRWPHRRTPGGGLMSEHHHRLLRSAKRPWSQPLTSIPSSVAPSRCQCVHVAGRWSASQLAEQLPSKTPDGQGAWSGAGTRAARAAAAGARGKPAAGGSSCCARLRCRCGTRVLQGR